MNILYQHKITENVKLGLIVRWSSDKNDLDIEFEYSSALAILLLEEVVFINDFWWMKNLEKEQRDKFSINVICSDVFGSGGTDSENLDFKELEDLFEHYIKDNLWGSAIWCIKKRKRMPQKSVYDKIQRLNIWDLDKIKEEERIT